MSSTTHGFVGAGQMAQALVGGFAAAGLVSAEQIVAYDPSETAAEKFVEQVPGAEILPNIAAVAERAEVLWLAVKPQNMGRVVEALRGKVSEQQLVVSIAAGISLEMLWQNLETLRLIRVMPNTPALIGCGASGYSLGQKATPEDGELVGELLSAVGVALEVPERQLDAVTGLSGSGPAFVYQIIEALSDGGVRMGLPREKASRLAAQTVLGAARMVLETGEHPAVLKDRVASPGGTTIAGLQTLEQGGLRAALMNAVEAAAERSRGASLE